LNLCPSQHIKRRFLISPCLPFSRQDDELHFCTIKGQKAACPLEAVVAKYLINEEWLKD
jgi:hypothetical protein